MREFFVQNETIILFAQGLVFFSLGFAVWLQRRRATRLTLTSSLIWLAAFAFVEALSPCTLNWGTMEDASKTFHFLEKVHAGVFPVKRY